MVQNVSGEHKRRIGDARLLMDDLTAHENENHYSIPSACKVLCIESLYISPCSTLICNL